MKQRFTKLLAAFALLVFMMPSLAGWGQSVDGYTATSSDKPSAVNGTTTGTVMGTNSISWSYSVTQQTKSGKSPYVAYSDSYGWQLGSSNSPCTAFSISTSNITGTITKVEVVSGSYNSSSNICVTVGDANFGTQNQTTGNGESVTTQTFEGSASGTIIVSATSSTRAFYFKSVTVTYSTTPTCVAPTFNPVSGKVNAGTVVTMSSQTEGATILYSDDNGANWTEGSSYTINQEVTLKAKATKDGYAESGVSTASYTIRGNAVFTDGLYRELLTTSESFENMQVENIDGDETWVFNSSYSCAYINSEADEIDWLISPKMAVENGKLNISFQIWHKNADNQLFLKWSASNDVNGSWHDLEFDEGARSGWVTVSNIEIETQDPYVYVAFVYDNTADENAGQYEIKDLQARQYYNVTFNANAVAGTRNPMVQEQLMLMVLILVLHKIRPSMHNGPMPIL